MSPCGGGNSIRRRNTTDLACSLYGHLKGTARKRGKRSTGPASGQTHSRSHFLCGAVCPTASKTACSTTNMCTTRTLHLTLAAACTANRCAPTTSTSTTGSGRLVATSSLAGFSWSLRSFSIPAALRIGAFLQSLAAAGARKWMVIVS